MRMLLTAAIATLSIASVAPAMAQGVYVGPDGVGVDTGVRPYGYHRQDRDDYYRHHRDRDGYYEGRSAYDHDDEDHD